MKHRSALGRDILVRLLLLVYHGRPRGILPFDTLCVLAYDDEHTALHHLRDWGKPVQSEEMRFITCQGTDRISKADFSLNYTLPKCPGQERCNNQNRNGRIFSLAHMSEKRTNLYAHLHQRALHPYYARENSAAGSEPSATMYRILGCQTGLGTSVHFARSKANRAQLYVQMCHWLEN